MPDRTRLLVRLGLASALLAVTASSAVGGGLNLTWGATPASQGCWTEYPEYRRTWTCISNTGDAAVMIGSFAPAADIPDFTGIEAVLDGQSYIALPAWWQGFNPGACRQNGFTCSGDFTGAPREYCADPFTGTATGGIVAWETALFPPPGGPVPAPDRFRIRIAYAMATPRPLSASTEYYAFRLTINKQKSVFTGSCKGCFTPVELTLSQLVVRGSSVRETIALPLENRCIVAFSGSATSCGFTPARNGTWGQIKSLYR